MAKTSVIVIPPGYEAKFFQALSSGDRFTYPRVRRQVLFSSRKKKKGLTLKSLLPEIAQAWAALSAGEQNAWSVAADEMGLNGYKLFVQDKAIRIKNELAGNATPVTSHQTWVGKIVVEDPADQITIAQFHPLTYWISKR